VRRHVARARVMFADGIDSWLVGKTIDIQVKISANQWYYG
jgi:hypothetical protein